MFVNTVFKNMKSMSIFYVEERNMENMTALSHKGKEDIESLLDSQWGGETDL